MKFHGHPCTPLAKALYIFYFGNNSLIHPINSESEPTWNQVTEIVYDLLSDFCLEF